MSPATNRQGLSVANVSVEYYAPARWGKRQLVKTAVDSVSFNVPPGGSLSLLGASGSGKSSLLRAICGLEPLTSGSISFDGVNLAGVPTYRRNFGLLFQDGQLFPHRNVERNIAYGLEAARVPKSERAQRVEELLELVGLVGYGKRSIQTLSGGQRQRVALARALAPKPRLILLDEPFSALDQALRHRLAAEVREILDSTGVASITVTHDSNEAQTMGSQIGVMEEGKLISLEPTP